MGNACGCIENKDVHLQDDQKEMNNGQRGMVQTDTKPAKQKTEPSHPRPEEIAQMDKKDSTKKLKSKEEEVSNQADTKQSSSKQPYKPEEDKTKVTASHATKPSMNSDHQGLNGASNSKSPIESKQSDPTVGVKPKAGSQGGLNPIPVPATAMTNSKPEPVAAPKDKVTSQPAAAQPAAGQKSQEEVAKMSTNPSPSNGKSHFNSVSGGVAVGGTDKPPGPSEELKRLAGSLVPTNPTVLSLLKKHGVYEPLTYVSTDDFTKQTNIKGGAVFEGELKQMAGSKQGHGRMLYPNGAFVEGYFVEYVLEGEGRIIKPNGEVYMGHFKEGEASGRGKYIKNSGEEYSGEFKNDKPNGSGTMKYVNGDLYSGEFVNGIREGRGVLNLVNGDRYEGVFGKGLFHGKGRYYWKLEEMRYDGEWKDGQMDGIGKFFWKDGNMYEGSYKAGLKHGKGALVVAGGPKYEGEWKEGKQHGIGKLIAQNGEVLIEGTWVSGEYTG